MPGMARVAAINQQLYECDPSLAKILEHLSLAQDIMKEH
jgi:hypothetical protein